jgi:hypothetical protein
MSESLAATGAPSEFVFSGASSSALANRLYRVLETWDESMHDSPSSTLVRREDSLTIAVRGQFVTCHHETMANSDRQIFGCRAGLVGADTGWGGEGASLASILYRMILLRQGGGETQTLVGDDGRSISCERRFAMGEASYRCVFQLDPHR